MTTSSLRHTPLHSRHLAAGAKMAPFADFDMPIQYTSLIAEHKHARSQAAVFDICHMGEFTIRGAAAQQELENAVSHNLRTLKPGRCRYGFLLNDQGGVVDDCILYCMDTDWYMLVVNGSRVTVDFGLLQDRLPVSVELEDISDITAKIDLQGPASLEVLEKVFGRSFRDLAYFNFIRTDFDGVRILVSRTGYTGELGYELYLPAEKVGDLWDACVADDQVIPAGLGARDTLRLEMGLPLYGQDLDENHTPAEAGYDWLLISEADYVGKHGATRVREKLIGLSISGRQAARHGAQVATDDGTLVGVVTSGSFAPSLGHAVALAYVATDAAEQESFQVLAGKKPLPATKAQLPFYTQGTARMKVSE